jgi:hypothetical protein
LKLLQTPKIQQFIPNITIGSTNATNEKANPLLAEEFAKDNLGNHQPVNVKFLGVDD